MKVPENVLTLNKVQEIILGEIIKSPGISQKELAESLSMSPARVNYHVSAMVNVGLIRIVRDGRFTKCYLGNGVAEA